MSVKNTNSFGYIMKTKRKEKHLTQEMLAKKLGISLGSVKMYERKY